MESDMMRAFCKSNAVRCILSVKRMCYVVVVALSVVMTLAACSKDDDGAFNPDKENADEIRYDGSRKILVVYFSGTGNTQRLAQQVADAAHADLFRIEAAEPYAQNPYDDSERIQNESYNNLRPRVAAWPDNVADYDVVFIGSPIWWHNPAMVVCSFLDGCNLDGKIVVPFFTYGSTTYLQQSIDKIYEVTPRSVHLATYSGRGSVEQWLRGIHIIE